MQKLKASLRALYVGPGHFTYSGNWPKKQEICITATGWIARVLGFIFRAEQW